MNDIIHNLPPLTTGQNKYPFSSMEVGDTFLLKPKERSKLASAAANYAKRHGIKLVVRNYVDGDGVKWCACQRQELNENPM